MRNFLLTSSLRLFPAHLSLFVFVLTLSFSVTSFRSGPHCARHCTHTYQRDRRCPRIDALRPAQALPPVIGWVEEPQGGRTAFDTQFPFCITSTAWGISTPTAAAAGLWQNGQGGRFCTGTKLMQERRLGEVSSCSIVCGF